VPADLRTKYEALPDKVTGRKNIQAELEKQYDKDGKELPADVKDRMDQVPDPTGMKKVRDELAKLYVSEARGMPEVMSPYAVQLAVAWGELLGGIAMLVGFLSRWAALGLFIIQLGAIWTVTFAKGFAFNAGGGYEFNVSLLGMCAAMFFLGSGTLSLDHWLKERRKQPSSVVGSPGSPAPMPADTGVLR